MSFTKRAYYALGNIKNLSKNKTVQRYSIFTLGFFLVLGFLFNSQTVAEPYQYNILEVYEEIDEFSSDSTNTDGKHSHKSQGFQIGDATGTMLDIVYPQGNFWYANIVANPNISPGAKLGIIGAADVSLTAILYNPPSINVTEHLAQEWVPGYGDGGSSVYAASGYQRLESSGVVVLWQMTRNIAYILFVLVFIVAGFMIMFRHKLGGQTMVTLYNTLPNIIVGLVLVTFSFAIVGFILDIGGVLIRVISNLLDITTSTGGDAVDPTKPLGIWETYSADVGRMLTSYGGVVKDFTDGIVEHLGYILEEVFSKLIGAILTVVLSIVIAFASFKIFFTLVKTYIAILFDTITGPIVLAIATIPGKQGLTKDWFNRLFKNTTVFVVVFLLVNLPLYFMENGYRFDIFGGNLVGEIDTSNWFVLNVIMAAVSVYLLFLAANVPKMLEDYFPQTKGQGAAGAAEGVKKDFSKIPGMGGFFK